MDTRNGEIYASLKAAMEAGVPREYAMEMEEQPTPRQQKRSKVGRNDPCPCGSGMKFKKCHLNKRAI